MNKKDKEGKFEILKTVVIAGLIALGFRSFLFEPFNIPSGSMVPTLLVGDYLFVSKASLNDAISNATIANCKRPFPKFPNTSFSIVAKKQSVSTTN